MNTKQLKLLVLSKYTKIGVLQTEIRSLEDDMKKMQSLCPHNEEIVHDKYMNKTCSICLKDMTVDLAHIQLMKVWGKE